MTTNPFIQTTSGLVPNAGLLGTPGAIVATSTTTQTIGVGTFVFEIQAQCAFAPGMWVSITNPENSAQWMWAQVTSYDGISQLTVDTANTNGAGTLNSWAIALAGSPAGVGVPGPDGATGATGAAAGPLNGAAQALKVKNNTGTPNTKIDITALKAVMVDSSGTSVLASAVSVTIDLTTGTASSTANGMDGHARGTSAWLYLYLINNGSITSGLATLTSPLSGAPTLPSGYTSSTYVGAMYVDGSGNLMRTLQLGKKSHYTVTAATNTAALPTMANGVAGSTVTPTWVSVATGVFCPATTSKIFLSANSNVGGTPTTVIVAPNNGYGNGASTNPPPIAAGATANMIHTDELLLETTNIFWASSSVDGYLFCIGWEDYCIA